jgi:hypothetical protein
MKRVFPWLLGLAVLLNVHFGANPAKAHVGDKIASLQTHPLMDYFSDPGADSISLGENTQVIYHPKGSYAARHVAMYMSLNLDGTIEQMDLLLDRQFVDTEWVRARNITNDFLHSAVAMEDEPALDDLFNEIEYPQDKGVNYRMTVPPLPKQPSAGYLVFTGKKPVFEQQGYKTVVRLQNMEAGGRKVLRISVQKADNYRKLFMVEDSPTQ